MAALSTYQSDYVKKQFIVSKLARPELPEYEELPEGAVWMDTTINVKEAGGKQASLQKIKEMYQHRMRSVYKMDYTGATQIDTNTAKIASDGGQEPEITDQMLETCKKLKLCNKLYPVLQPLKGARNVFGYMNPKYFHTEITVYQHEICKNACNTMFGEDLTKTRGFLDKTK